MAFVIGLLCCYISAPNKHLVVKFPSPNNVGLIYRNKEGCYKYDAKKISCSDNVNRTRAQPFYIHDD